MKIRYKVNKEAAAKFSQVEKESKVARKELDRWFLSLKPVVLKKFGLKLPEDHWFSRHFESIPDDISPKILKYIIILYLWIIILPLGYTIRLYRYSWFHFQFYKRHLL